MALSAEERQGIVEKLSAATVLEVADLVKDLEEKWGVSAAAPVAVAAAGGGGEVAEAEVQDEFDVMLTAIGKTVDQLDEVLEEWNIPLARLGTPQDIGAACVYLASDAASWVSGEIIRVGGGARPR